MADNESNEQGGEGATDAGTREVSIAKIYLKDVSFESPRAPTIFRGEWSPKAEMQVSTQAKQVDQELYEVVLTVTVTARDSDAEEATYLAEIQQAGLFSLRGFDQDQLGGLLGSYCPQILFPFAREAISDLVTKGGFTPMLLTPVNFEAAYREHLRQQQAAGTAETAGQDGQ